MKMPVHRWFRYSAGFSAAWVERVVSEHKAEHGNIKVFDPFAGSGTTLIASQSAGVDSVGLESHPMIARVAQAKLLWSASPDDFQSRANVVLSKAKLKTWRNPPQLLARIYRQDTLAQLNGLHFLIEAEQQGDDIDRLLWLALVAILRACSPVGTAQWQYVLPNKTKARTADPATAFASQVQMMATDMREMPVCARDAQVNWDDARLANTIQNDTIDLVVTSPPYPNNYDYADATRIEMTFLKEIEAWGDLQGAVRTHLVRSCSQHMVRYNPDEALSSPEISPIRDSLQGAYDRLTVERELHGGRKAYNSMVVAYFHDLARTFATLRRVCRPEATLLFVVGDSAPYSVHIPVEKWLGELALGAGFHRWSFTKMRDRNIKWRNRKHRVPLHEGLLTIHG